MDLNYLYHRQQVSLYMAQHAASRQAHAAHLELAAGYGRMIAAAKAPDRMVAA